MKKDEWILLQNQTTSTQNFHSDIYILAIEI